MKVKIVLEAEEYSSELEKEITEEQFLFLNEIQNELDDKDRNGFFCVDFKVIPLD